MLELLKNKGEYMLGACMPSVKSCTTYMWNYVKEGNRFCPRDNMGLDRVCCCGNNLRLLTNETIPAKNDPQLLQYIENYELE